MLDSSANTLIAFCPECDTRIRFHTQPRMGQLVTCRECGEISEVIRVNPVRLDWAYAEEEEQYRYDQYTSQPRQNDLRA
ncbi:MAG: hypothetical protein R3E31_27585 [Chloroflexota bacterium]|nr:hypothetical protein [Anaerolineales bacterium]MCA9974402.1 hypothetical protein [Anaerolineales bacterium]